MNSNNDLRIDKLAGRLLEPNDRHRETPDDDDDDEAIFAELEAEIENADSEALREAGMQAMKAQMENLKNIQQSQHGRYTEVMDEKEVIRITAREPLCVVHFYHPDFKRCEIMDKHLAILAPKYFNTRFFRVFVENIPWLVEKLAIKVLPCVICFVNGVTKDRLVGFEEVGNKDDFPTATLELRLSQCKVIQKPQSTSLVYNVRSATTSRGKSDDDDPFDLDD